MTHLRTSYLLEAARHGGKLERRNERIDQFDVNLAAAASLRARELGLTVEASATDIQFGPERKLFDWEVAREYDVSPSGEFYSMEAVPGAAQQTAIQLKTRWFEEVERVVRR